MVPSVGPVSRCVGMDMWIPRFFRSPNEMCRGDMCAWCALFVGFLWVAIYLYVCGLSRGGEVERRQGFGVGVFALWPASFSFCGLFRCDGYGLWDVDVGGSSGGECQGSATVVDLFEFGYWR